MLCNLSWSIIAMSCKPLFAIFTLGITINNFRITFTCTPVGCLSDGFHIGIEESAFGGYATLLRHTDAEDERKREGQSRSENENYCPFHVL